MFQLPGVPTTFIGTAQEFNLGQLFIDNGTGALYRYVKNGGADTTVYGKLACRKSAAGRGVMTMTVADVTSGTLSTLTKPDGIWQAAIPLNGYGLVLVCGLYFDVYTDDGVVDGDALVCDGGGTETFIADTAADGEEEGVFGWACAADNDTTHLVKANVNCL